VAYTSIYCLATSTISVTYTQTLFLRAARYSNYLASPHESGHCKLTIKTGLPAVFNANNYGRDSMPTHSMPTHVHFRTLHQSPGTTAATISNTEAVKCHQNILFASRRFIRLHGSYSFVILLPVPGYSRRAGSVFGRDTCDSVRGSVCPSVYVFVTQMVGFTSGKVRV